MCSSSGVLLNASSIILTAPTKQGGSRYKLPGPAVRKGTRGPTMLDMFLSFLVPQLFFNLQVHPFRPSTSHSEIDTLIDSEHSILVGPPLMAGQKTIFSAGLEPTFGAPAF